MPSSALTATSSPASLRQSVGSLSRVGDRRVMQHDLDLALIVQDVAERVFDLHQFALRIGEEVVAHRHGGIAVKEHRGVFEADCGPTFDCEAAVFSADFVGGNKIGESLFERPTKLDLGRQRRLEQHRRGAVVVEVLNVLLGGLLIVFAILVRCGDADDAVAPCLLGGGEMLFGKGAHSIDSNLNLRRIPARKAEGRTPVEYELLISDLRPKFSSVNTASVTCFDSLLPGICFWRKGRRNLGWVEYTGEKGGSPLSLTGSPFHLDRQSPGSVSKI